MKKILVVTLLLLTATSAALCQDLLIKYDMVNKNIEYYKIKKSKGAEKLVQMKNPRIGPNRNVRVEYVNMNPFIWKQPSVNLVSVQQDSVSTFNPFTMMLPSTMADRFGSIGFSFTRDAASLTPQQRMCAYALKSLYEAYDKMNAVKYDYKLTKEQILAQSAEKLHSVLATCNLAEGTDSSRMKVTRSDFESLKSYFRDICQIDIPGLTRSGTNSKTDAFLGSAGIDANSSLLPPTEAISTIEKSYFDVSEADFSSENSFIVSDKDIVMHMNFSLSEEYMTKAVKDTTRSGDKKSSKVRDQSIFIPVSGGVRVSSSAGIGFTYLGGARKSYFINEDSILSSTVDHKIVPVVGTFLNVYSRGMGAVNLGGSFGIFAAFEETLNINYMMGMTAVIGRKERVLVSVGCAMVPVEEPSKGYHVGMYTTNLDFPTDLEYKPGVFFCVHYNVGKF